MEPDRVGTDAGRDLANCHVLPPSPDRSLMIRQVRASKTSLIKLVGLLVASWVVMTTTHEAGHLLGGWLCGATLIDFQLLPLRLPCTSSS